MSIIEKAIDKITDNKARKKRSDESASSMPDHDKQQVDGGVKTSQAKSSGNKVLIWSKSDKVMGHGDDGVIITEQFRRIKRPLINNASGFETTPVKNGNLIMVTSALSGEGKTFTAINLAKSIAMERDKKVLLVDVDLGRPSISRLLDADGGAGLVDYLLDEVSVLDGLICETDIPNLKVMLSGRHHPHSVELLSSNNMKKLMAEFASRYSDRIVIFDAPPLLVTNEAVVLSEMVGQVVMVVAAEESKQSDVKNALKLLGKDKTVGLLLNKCHHVKSSDHYGYGVDNRRR